MTIREAFKLFVKELTGTEPTGDNIADVIRDGAGKINTNISDAVTYTDNGKAIVLSSSTASSKKQFKITVTDDGTISATEVTG